MSVLQLPMESCQFHAFESQNLVNSPPSYQEVSQISELEENNWSNTLNRIYSLDTTLPQQN